MSHHAFLSVRAGFRATQSIESRKAQTADRQTWAAALLNGIIGRPGNDESTPRTGRTDASGPRKVEFDDYAWRTV
jgi:hypothetical protein